MVPFLASAVSVVIDSVGCVIGAARHESQRSKIVVKRVVFLHYDDDVLHFVKAALGKHRSRSG
jgi:hypothetical protein